MTVQEIKSVVDRAKRKEENSELERHEAKFIIPPALVPEIRAFIRPFCKPDPNASGDPPEYCITTLQLDSTTLALHYAKEYEALNRFKLRCRTYGTTGKGPVFLEIKRKVKGIIVKSRILVPRASWSPEIVTGRATFPFRSRHERISFAEFRRLMHELDAQPVMLIRYIRESYLGTSDDYARITFDRKLQYCPARGWAVPPMNVKWRCMDSGTALNRPYSGVILEMKTYRDAPLWMVHLTKRFSLVRVGFCKYSTAMRLESLFQGALYSDTSENCTFSVTGI